MKNVDYVAVADGTYAYMVDYKNNTFKLVMNDGELYENFDITITSESSSIEGWLEEENLRGFRNITPVNQIAISGGS